MIELTANMISVLISNQDWWGVVRKAVRLFDCYELRTSSMVGNSVTVLT